ncbi:MAG: ABC transporter ATP-binding protein [Chloroflexi bacterium]|nr:ABC transporter ATP-binding protein [Chloroflexota bacterium]
MDAVVRLQGLTKYYGKHLGVRDLDLEVQRGAVFGYLGPNGAGKTTTIRLLLDFLRPTSGRAWVLGHDAQKESPEVRRRVGYIPGEPALYKNLTGQDFLAYAASLRGGVDWSSIRSLAQRLDCDLSRPIGTLSRGNRQKIAVVHAFMHNPEVLFLDEPTSGLDPLMQQEFNSIVREARAAGQTVFLSSHILSEVEELCDQVGIIRSGQLVKVESVAALKARALRSLDIEFGGPVPQGEFVGLKGVSDVTVTDSHLHCKVTGALDPLVKAAARYQVVNIVTHQPSLEEIFLAFYGKEEPKDVAA